MQKDDCIFCKIVKGEIPSRTVYEDEQFKVILDLEPATQGHALILPKDHYANLFEIPENVAADAMKVAKKMAIQMKKNLNCEGFNIVQNNGEIAGQTVLHFHMHLIPRYHDDDQNILWDKLSVTSEYLDEVRDQIIK